MNKKLAFLTLFMASAHTNAFYHKIYNKINITNTSQEADIVLLEEGYLGGEYLVAIIPHNSKNSVNKKLQTISEGKTFVEHYTLKWANKHGTQSTQLKLVTVLEHNDISSVSCDLDPTYGSCVASSNTSDAIFDIEIKNL